MPRRLVVADGPQDELIDILVASRLVTSDDEVVEIAHEALARAWPRLRAWLDDDIEGQRLLHHLTESADAWDSLGRPDSELYRGTRLTRALEWRTSASAELTPTERDFLDDGRRLAEHEERSAVERAHVQARLIRRLRGVLAGASLLLVAALIAGGLAVQQKRSSDANASAALTAKTASDARRVGAKALLLEDLDESMLLAAQGALLDRSPETVSNLLAVLAKRPGLIGSVQTDAASLSGLDVSQDGRTLAAYDTTGGVRLYDTQSWQLTASRMNRSAGVEPFDPSGPIALNPDGRSLAVGMPALSPRPITLVDSADLDALPAQLPGLPGKPSRTWDLDYSADGSSIAATFLHLAHGPAWEGVAASVMVWDISEPARPVVEFKKRLTSKKTHYSNSVVLSRHGGRVYTSNPLTAYGVASGKVLYSTHHPSLTMALAPDDGTVAISGNESRGSGNQVLLVDAASGTVRSSLRGHTDTILGLLFSPDLASLVSLSGDRSAAVWDLRTGEMSERFSLDEWALGMGLSPDGKTLYTAGEEGSVRSWDLAGDRRFLSRVAAPKLFKLGFVNPEPGGAHVLYSTGDGLRFLDMTSGESTPQLDPGPGFGWGGGSWQPGTDRFVSVNGGVVHVWNKRTGKLIKTKRPAGRFVSEIDYTPDGSKLVIGELSGRVTMLDARTLEPLGRAADVGEPVCCLSASVDDRTALVLTGGPGRSPEFFPHVDGWSLVDLVDGREITSGDLDLNGNWVALSPDGTRAAIAGTGGEVAVLDVRSGELVGRPRTGHEDVTGMVAFSPDGSRIVSAGWDGTVSLWDSATGVLLGTVTSPARIPASAEFLPDGRTVLIASYDESLYLWDTRFEHAIHFACQLAGRNLTESEWRENFGDRPYRQTCPSESSH
jgi:WD40 repeat protein